MKIHIHPSTPKGTVQAPPSKSMAHRLLIAAGLAKGTSVIEGVAPSEDLLATLDCLTALGADCHYEKGSVTVDGIGGKTTKEKASLPCRECGSTLRFFLPIALLSEEETSLSGSPRLLERPMTVYEELCRESGLFFQKDENKITVKGKLKSGSYKIPGNISSQFISGLLFALPLTEGESKIVITPPVESRSYIDLTVKALHDFGVKVFWENETTLLVPGNQQYQPRTLRVEGDYSNAAFFSALALLGANVTVTGLSEDSLQGDRIYFDYFDRLKKGAPTLSLADCPDLGPVLFALAGALNGATFTDTARLKIKESDRGTAMAEELLKLGITAELSENKIVLHKGLLHAPVKALFSHNDHRIAMALSLLLTKVGGVIEGAEAVNKSLPDFYERLVALGVVITKQ